MDFIELAKKRYSVRNFSTRPIEDEKLNAVLEAGNIAPTAKNQQPQRIYVIKSPENLEKVRRLTRCHYGAPAVLLIAYDKNEEWQNPLEEGVHSGVEDVSIVATHIMLRAAELELGTVWVNMFSPSETRKEFGISENEVPVLLMPIGYPTDNDAPAPGHTNCKPLSDTVKMK